MDTIASLRREIDRIHLELHDCLSRRRDLTMAIWKIKQEQGVAFLSPEREEQILADFVGHNAKLRDEDPLFDELLRGVMTSILREYEKYLKGKFSSPT